MVICFSCEKQVSVAPRDVYRPSILFFQRTPLHWPSINPLWFKFLSNALDRLWRENRGSVNRLGNYKLILIWLMGNILIELARSVRQQTDYSKRLPVLAGGFSLLLPRSPHSFNALDHLSLLIMRSTKTVMLHKLKTNKRGPLRVVRMCLVCISKPVISSIEDV